MVKLQLTSWTRSSVGFRTPPSYGGSARSGKSFSLIRGFLCACDLPLETKAIVDILLRSAGAGGSGPPRRPRPKGPHSLAALGHPQVFSASAPPPCPNRRET